MKDTTLQLKQPNFSSYELTPKDGYSKPLVDEMWKRGSKYAVEEFVRMMKSIPDFFSDNDLVEKYRSIGLDLEDKTTMARALPFSAADFIMPFVAKDTAKSFGPKVLLRYIAWRWSNSIKLGPFDASYDIDLTFDDHKALHSMIKSVGHYFFKGARNAAPSHARRLKKNYPRQYDQMYTYTDRMFEEECKELDESPTDADKLFNFCNTINMRLSGLIRDNAKYSKPDRNLAAFNLCRDLLWKNWLSPLDPSIGRLPKAYVSTGKPVGRPKKPVYTIPDIEGYLPSTPTLKSLTDPLIALYATTLKRIDKTFKINVADSHGRRITRRSEDEFRDEYVEKQMNVGNKKQWVVQYGGVTILSSHLVWYLTDGTWPTSRVFHIDNEILNTDRKNLSLTKDGKEPRKFQAACRHDGKVVHIGYYSTEEFAKEAVNQYKQMRCQGYPDFICKMQPK